MAEGRAARRLAVALAEHLRLGRGVSERSISHLAATAKVGLDDRLSPPGPAAVARPSASGDTTVSSVAPLRCVRCHRWLKHPVEWEGRVYGSTCVRLIAALDKEQV